MPLSDSNDPIVREILRIRNETRGEVRRLYVITAALFILLALAVATSLYLRANDLAAISRKNATEQVRTCFRSAQQRPELRSISNDPTLSDSVRGFVKAVYENTPTVKECRQLAEKLHTPLPRNLE